MFLLRVIGRDWQILSELINEKIYQAWSTSSICQIEKSRPWAAGQKPYQYDETEHGVNCVVVALQELYVPVLVVSFTAISISVCHDKLTWEDRLYAVKEPVLMLQDSWLMLSKVQLDQRPYFHGKLKGHFCDVLRSLCCTGVEVSGTAWCVQERHVC